MNSFSLTFTPVPQDIDELGHVNNTVWVRWIQDLATAHWNAWADPADIAAYIWMVTRHEIDYRGNIGPGDSVAGRTWLNDPPKGAQFDRHVEFTDCRGKAIVRAKSRWAMIDRESRRLVRIPANLAARFLM